MKVSIIGSGNVGSALSKKLFDSGHTIIEVFSRDLEKAQRLASIVGAKACNKLDKINSISEIYLIAVHDDAIFETARHLKFDHAVIAHCSGATSVHVFKDQLKHYGVFYPLQTFTSGIEPDFSELPICVSASDIDTEQKLFTLAKSICPNIFKINEEQRKGLHVAAVLVNNFTNMLFSVADDICENENLNFKMLLPLIRQTVRKIEQNKPIRMQTGPAARKDFGTIKSHLEWLKQHNPKYTRLYELLSNSIIESLKE